MVDAGFSNTGIKQQTVFAFLAIPKFGYPAVIVCEPLIWCLMFLELMLSFWFNPYIRKNNKAR